MGRGPRAGPEFDICIFKLVRNAVRFSDGEWGSRMLGWEKPELWSLETWIQVLALPLRSPVVLGT